MSEMCLREFFPILLPLSQLFPALAFFPEFPFLTQALR
jgi:hypothetical protein